MPHASDNQETGRPRLPDAIERETARARELFVRHPNNPILQPRDMPVPCKAVCNPGACLFDGKVLLLLRVIDDDNHSSLHVATSENGVGNWQIDPKPLLSPFEGSRWYDNWGCEDPRITFLEELNEFFIVYVGWSRFGAGVCIAKTTDFKTATRIGMAIHPYNKDAALFPRRINGRFQLLHRPTAGPLENIWVSESDDLIHWGNPRCVLEESDQPGWDQGKVGCGPPPVETPRGWSLLFHGVQQVEGDWLYRFGWAMLDLDDPSKLIARWPDWVFGPSEPYELRGKKPGIVFPTGSVAKDGTVMIYYGAADTCIGLATANQATLRAFGEDAWEEMDAISERRPPHTAAEREHGAP